MAWRRPGDKPLSEPMMVNLLTHICVTGPQWVKGEWEDSITIQDSCEWWSIHLCSDNGSDNGSSPIRRRVIIWTSNGLLLIGPLGTDFNEILTEIHTFSFKKMHLKMSSGKWRPFCLSHNVLRKNGKIPIICPQGVHYHTGLVWMVKHKSVLIWLIETRTWQTHSVYRTTNEMHSECCFN